METFLSHTVRYILKKHFDDFSKLTLVLPNRRAKVFLTKYIAEHCEHPVWSPLMLTSEELVQRSSGLQIIDSVTLLAELFRVHKNIEESKAQSFEEFLNWGQTLIHDFNEVDLYMLNPDTVFNYLSEARALERWNVDNNELTSFEKNYLHFYQSLYPYYKALKERLLSKKQAWQGLAFRHTAEHAQECLVDEDQFYIFIGFNAFTACEEQIITVLKREDKVELIWDMDKYYLDDKNQEAGLFMRKYMRKNTLSNINFVYDNFEQTDKEINVYGVSGTMGIAQFGAQKLREVLNENAPARTALVLADENLIFPVLNNLPNKVESINVTMGVPVSNSPVFDFFNALINLHINAARFKVQNEEIKYYHKDLNAVLSHALIAKQWEVFSVDKKLPGQVLRSIEKTFVGKHELLEAFKDSSAAFVNILVEMFSDWDNDMHAVVLKCLRLVDVFQQSFSEHDTTDYRLMREYLFSVHKVLNQMVLLIKDDNPLTTLQSFKLVFGQLAAMQKLSFVGEPLEGVQVMGMLETRLLDFDNVILLSANEDVLPRAKSNNSFIPHDIKIELGLPTHTEKDAIFAYHFYRLIQRAKNVSLVYNTRSGSFGGGDKSRFVSQLLHEYKKKLSRAKIKEHIVLTDTLVEEEQPVQVVKDKQVINRLEAIAEKGFSPTALINYSTCPLQFYFKNVLGVNEDVEIEESIDARTMGTVIHEVLEDLYGENLNIVINESHYKKWLKQIPKMVEEKYQKHYKANDYLHGKNYLIVSVTTIYLNNFLKTEMEWMKKSKSSNLTILSLEMELKKCLKVRVQGVEKKIKFRGIADRVDRLGNLVRLLDYKTGFVQDADVRIKDISELSEKFKPKAFQLLMYAWMYGSPKDSNLSMLSGIYALRKKSKMSYPLEINKNPIIGVDELEAFEAYVSNLVMEILDPDFGFCQTEDRKKCEFCNYKIICKR